MPFFAELLRPYGPLADVLDWRLRFAPPVSHPEAFAELQDLARAHGIRARGVRRVSTNPPFSGVPTWKDVLVDLDLDAYYPVLDNNGRATGDMYPVERGPDHLLLIQKVEVELTDLWERWHALIDSRIPDNTPPAPEQQNVETEDEGAAPVGTIAQERRCREWLIGLMKDNPSPVKRKGSYQSEAIARYKISKRAFGRAWGQAVTETGNANWIKAGPKPKRRP
jgi:hypothetical protein